MLHAHEILIAIGKLTTLVKDQTIYSKEYLTAAETAKYLNISIHQVYKYSSGRILPHYKPQQKVLYFKRSELDQWINSGRIKSHFDISSEVDNYLSHRSNNSK